MAVIRDALGNPIFDDVQFLNTILSTLGANVTLDLDGQACAAVQVEAIGTMTLVFEGSVDGTDFFPVFGVVPGTGAFATSTTTNGIWIFEVGAFTKFRVRVSLYTVGTVSVSVKASQGTTVVQLAAGSISITGIPATVTQGPGTATPADPWEVAVTDTADVTVKPGDAANNAVRVNVVAGSSGGPSKVDDAAFAVGTDTVAPAGYLADETAPDSVNEGDVGIPRMSLNRVPYAQIRDAAGNERGANITAGNAVVVDGSAVTQPVSAASLPLPAGASTLAGQTQPGVDIGDVTVNNAAGASAVNIQDGGNSITIDGTITATADGQAADGAAVVGNPVRIGGKDGGGLTQDIITDASGVLAVQDNGGSLTVDSPQLPAVLAAGGGLQIEGVAGGVVVPISAASLPLPTGASTLAGQTQPGVDIGDVTINNAAGAAAVNVQDGGNSLTVDGSISITGAVDTELPAAVALADNTANPTVPGVGAFLMAFDGTNWDRVQTGAAAGGALKVDGSAVTQPVSAASLPLPTGASTLAGQTQPGVDIGDVTVNNVAGTNPVPVQGNAAHDAAVAGNPVRIGARADTTEVLAVADGDTVDLLADLNGKLVTLNGAVPERSVDGLTASIVGTADTAVIAAPGAGLRNYITQVLVTNGHATVGTYVNLKSAATSRYTGYARQAGGGFSLTFVNPLRLGVNEAFNAANVTTGSDTRVSASGYIAP